MSAAFVAALRRVLRIDEVTHRDGACELVLGGERVSLTLRDPWIPGGKPTKLAFEVVGFDGYELGLRGYPSVRHVPFGDTSQAALDHVRDHVALAAYHYTSNDDALTTALLDGPPRRALINAVTAHGEWTSDQAVAVTLHGLDAVLDDDRLVVVPRFADDHNLATAAPRRAPPAGRRRGRRLDHGRARRGHPAVGRDDREGGSPRARDRAAVPAGRATALGALAPLT